MRLLGQKVLIGTKLGTVAPMPALNLEFTDDEMADLRAAAEREGRSLKSLAHDAVVRSVSSRKHRVEEAAARIARISADLNERLAR